MRGSREISLVPSLHRASTDALIAYCNVYPGLAKPVVVNCRVYYVCGNDIKVLSILWSCTVL